MGRSRKMNFGEVYDFASEVADQMIAEKQQVPMMHLLWFGGHTLYQVEQCRQTVKSFLVSQPSTTKDAMVKESSTGTASAKKYGPLETSEGSGIKVSISQDNLLKSSPQHKLSETSATKERPSTTPADLSRSLPTITEKIVTAHVANRAASSKSSRCEDKCRLACSVCLV